MIVNLYFQNYIERMYFSHSIHQFVQNLNKPDLLSYYTLITIIFFLFQSSIFLQSKFLYYVLLRLFYHHIKLILFKYMQL